MEDAKVQSGLAVSAAAPRRSAPPAPKPPEPLEFITENLPPVSALDYDVIKLTAQYVARNGRQLMAVLAQRETHNPQFDFLRAGHSLHGVFLRLIDQYTRVFLPSKTLLARLRTYAEARPEIVNRVMDRTAYTRHVRRQQVQQEAAAERDRIAYAEVDWNDFVVVETIDFSPVDMVSALPRPLDLSFIVNLSLVQRRELWHSNALQGHRSPDVPEEEEAMEVEELSGSSVQEASSAVGRTLAMAATEQTPVPDRPSKQVALDHDDNGMPIRHGYIPRAQTISTAMSAVGDSEVCPICNQAIPKGHIAEHMRIEALDPRWKEQRDRYLAKRQETNYLTSGTDVAQNLRTMYQARAELVGMREEEVARALKEASQISASQTVIWDGRIDPASIATATREALQKSKPILQSQMEALQQQHQQQFHAQQPYRKK